MRNEERERERETLDREQRYLRGEARRQGARPQWLRRMRRALGASAVDMAEEMGMHRSAIFRLEKSEATGAISLKRLERMAEAMGCRLVYAIVPRGNKTVAEMAEWRKWEKKLGNQEQGLGTREAAG